jgi:hypothetical protein
VDWAVQVKKSGVVEAKAVDRSGNEEKMLQRVVIK